MLAQATAAREELKVSRRDLLKLRNEDSSLRAMYGIARGRLQEQGAKIEELQARLDALHADAEQHQRRRSLLAGLAADGDGLVVEDALQQADGGSGGAAP